MTPQEHLCATCAHTRGQHDDAGKCAVTTIYPNIHPTQGFYCTCKTFKEIEPPELTAPAPYLSDEERETIADLIEEETDRINHWNDGGASDTWRAMNLGSIAERIRNVPTDPRLGTVLRRHEVHVLLKAIDIARPTIGGPLSAVYRSLSEIESKLRDLAKLEASWDRKTRHDDSDNWHTDDRGQTA